MSPAKQGANGGAGLEPRPPKWRHKRSECASKIGGRAVAKSDRAAALSSANIYTTTRKVRARWRL